MRPAVLTALCLLRWFYLATGGQRWTNTHVFYAVELEGGSRAAGALAQKHGLRFISRIGNLEGHYTLRGSGNSPILEHALALHAGVKWVQRQNIHFREKRAALQGLKNNTLLKFAELPGQKQRRRGFGDTVPDSLHFNDPLWPMQWELFNHGHVSLFDLNVMPVWLKNITGRGVVVSIIDDGVDHSNLDLRKNFEAFASFDLRGAHGLSHDPMPQRDEENGHGTKCAGEVAMEANNSFCGVGIAFNARIGGIRLLDGSVTDSMEATALTYNNDFIHIYICCWGPRDNGAEMAGPGTLTEKALHLGTRKGRGGKGSIFVWAAGNGGMMNDHCGADGYVNSIYTIAIGAVTHTGSPASFGEPCPAVMAVTLTGSNTINSPPLVTVSNLGDGCITQFAGTSSAAPAAAGVLALVLEANPDLTWRDVQHLIAKTAKIPDPYEPGWTINGAGYHVHDRYGFGLLDAALMVQKALQFQSVEDQRKCEESVALQPVRILPSGGKVSMAVRSEACKGQRNEINTLEHVQVTVDVSSVCRGDLSVELVSPVQTHSVLLDTRRNDRSEAGLRRWTLMTVQNWGENPQGTWRLTVKDNKETVPGCKRSNSEEAAGAVLNITLTLYGTYNPNKTNHDIPLSGFISLGERHNIPSEGVSVRNRFLPQDLIHRAFRLEQSNKILPEDIQHGTKWSKKPEVQNIPDSKFSSKDMDDTDGEALKSHLLKLWNTLRNTVQEDQVQYNTLTQANTQQAQRADRMLPRSLQSGAQAVLAARSGIRVQRHISVHMQKLKNLRSFRKSRTKKQLWKTKREMG
ncbi:PC3-like endoprotease variant B [Pygocentrus nattereri]|uniref:P/Homo B domain-containing protein n=1 Tax=Pygocentrus nattereri TaxID=42514 RepID=A0A3B4D4S5_PYGNA|nr:PC3-like endoprotease variant B [Pygocentrus nattereri]XP_037386800.1 PC3-like endoprotease variant B [Pygocentrus nattereri]